MMKLFPENMGEASFQKELEHLQQEHSEYDPAYVNLSTTSRFRQVKKWMEELWKQYEPYADPHFLDEFKHRCSCRSWELYLGTTFLNRGLKLESRCGIGPDFCVTGEHQTVWVEAVVAEKGEGENKVPAFEMGTVVDFPEEKMLLRISNSLDYKFKKYQEYLRKGIIKDGEPYVIAVNSSDLGYGDSDIPLILKALFGIGHLTVTVPLSGRQQKSPAPYWSERADVAKRSGKNIPMLFFANEAHSGVSATIYSYNNILNGPMLDAEMGEDLSIVHNPYAKVALPNDFFVFGDEYKFYSKEDGSQVKKIRKRKKWARSPYIV